MAVTKAERSAQGHFGLIVAIALGTMLNPLNTSMIAVAFSRLQEEFAVDYSAISWLIATYYVASAVAQPVMGKLGDLFGRKRLFLAGLGLVTVSSMLAPFSASIGWLMVFRVIQAIGTSALYPSGMGIIRQVVTSKLARTLGVMSIFASTSAAFGPSVGGILLHYSDWPAIFLINFPVILVSFILAVRWMPKDGAAQKPAPGALDGWGILFFIVLIVTWLFFFLSFQTGVSFGLLAAALALTAGFYVFEARRRHPFVDVRFLAANRQVTLVYLQFILVNIVFYSVMFGIPSYLQQVRAFDSQQVGLLMLAISGFGVFVTPLVGRWIDRKGSKTPLITGSLIVLTGALLLLTLHDDSSPAWIFLVLAVLGISGGFHNLGLQTALFASVATSETGIASGLFMTSRFMGTILSSSLLGAAFGHGITTGKLHGLAAACAVIGVLILWLSLRLPARAGTVKPSN
ncbi:MFS transporter [Paenibacillus puerhi]|uniref:MFS transporter n=1 Tax=Paenibacillus puerhi TaxID=2692622 RepID=UPI00135765A6|nr:MFS transporter [Paenibacillus puerhi]